MEHPIVSKCNYFRQIGLWPAQHELNFEAWLSNFLPPEKDYALALLNRFTFYSDPLSRQLFQASFHGISRALCRGQKNHREASLLWNTFLDKLILTRVTGELPNDTDSGYRYARMARQHLGIRENQIMAPEVALVTWMADPQRPVVFVDDFLGSGQQFIKTWKKLHFTEAGPKTSFQAEARRPLKSKIIYCVPVSTSLGIANIKAVAPDVIVESAHVLTPASSLVGAESRCWPANLKQGAEKFIIAASRRAGIAEGEHFGFRDLGLAIAFEHCIPDASLPIFYTENDDWKPLRRRT